MLSQADNMRLTRTGPETPMGQLLRQYWIPALMADELPESDCRPVRIKLLGEELLAFRDSSRRIGLVDQHCAHRGASLFFARNEEHGIRCVYHGWKYEVDGRCVDMPNEPPESNFKDTIRLKAYPCRERGGIIWAYLGTRRPLPALPELEWAMVPDGQRRVSKRIQDCNYLQALEGGVDLSHLSFLHRNLDTRREGTDQELTRRDPSPTLEIVDTEGGLMIAARRSADQDRSYWRISQWLMPWYTMFPPLIDEGMGGHAWVPVDDETCWAFSFTWNPHGRLAAGRPEGLADEGIFPDLISGTYRPTANRDNDYLIDRAEQRATSFTGIPGIAAQDCAVQESMGPVCDRTRERLGSSDIPIIAVRQRLMRALQSLQAGKVPPGLEPASHRVRPAALVLPRSMAIQEGVKTALVAGANT